MVIFTPGLVMLTITFGSSRGRLRSNEAGSKRGLEESSPISPLESHQIVK